MSQRTSRIIYNLVADDIEKTANFYERLCGLNRLYTSDWYIVLTPGEDRAYELGVISRSSNVTPEGTRGGQGGGYLTFVVDDMDAARGRAADLGATILEEPTALDYGQTRMLLSGPDGVVIDISTPTGE